MKLRKIVICLFTIFFTAAAMFCAKQERQTRIPFSFQAVTEEGTETIRYWQNEDGECYVFLPSYVNLSQLILHSDTPIWLDGRKLSYGMSCEGIELEREYALAGDTGTPGSITFLQSQNLPSIYIDTPSESMDYIHSVKGNKEFAKMRLYSRGGQMEFGGRLESIQARGNSTFGKLKKQYSIALGSSSDLLNMGSAKKWILQANSFDPTNLRNKIVYDFAAQAGLPYSPESRFVDLYLNGNYAGLYQLCERNQVHPQRVNISEENSTLVSVEFPERLAMGDKPYFLTEHGTAIRVQYTSMSEQTLHETFQTLENALSAANGVDPQTGKHWLDLIDLDSWARKYLIEEIFGNVDGGRASQFAYVDGSDPDRKIFSGPVWDYDLAMSNPATYFENGVPDTYRDQNFNMFFIQCNKDTWFYPMMQNEIFRNRVIQLYRQDFAPLLEALVDKKIDDYAWEIAPSAHLDQIRWNERDPGAETAYLKECIMRRLNFLNSIWLDQQPYLFVTARQLDRTVTYAIQPGDQIPELPAYAGYEWYDARTQLPADLNQRISEDLELYTNPISVPDDPEKIEEPDDAFRETEQKTSPTFSRLTLLPFLLMLIILAVACIKDRLCTRKNIQKTLYFVSSTD